MQELTNSETQAWFRESVLRGEGPDRRSGRLAARLVVRPTLTLHSLSRLQPWYDTFGPCGSGFCRCPRKQSASFVALYSKGAESLSCS